MHPRAQLRALLEEANHQLHRNVDLCDEPQRHPRFAQEKQDAQVRFREQLKNKRCHPLHPLRCPSSVR